jgi:hypothetical protein
MTFFFDRNGEFCCRVPLTNADESVVIRKADYDRLKAAGLSNDWRIAVDGNVWARRAGMGSLSVAHCVLQGDHETQLHYVNGNRLDLRPSNLEVIVA